MCLSAARTQQSRLIFTFQNVKHTQKLASPNIKHIRYVLLIAQNVQVKHAIVHVKTAIWQFLHENVCVKHAFLHAKMH